MTSSDTTVIYVTREIERALGMAPQSNYRIVSNRTPYGEIIQKQYPEFVTLIDAPATKLLGTTDLLSHETTRTLLKKFSTPVILVFKNTMRVESAARTLNSRLLNPPAMLSERVENKLSFMRWLGPLAAKYLPPHTAKVTKLISWRNEPFVIQWAHGHTGDGTILINNQDDLRAIQDRFPERMARLSTYISGPSFTVNAIVTPERILIGNVSYQITGLAPFTDNMFSTIGNDWALAHRFLSNDDLQSISTIVTEIGRKLQSEGWKGLFGVDVIRDDVHKRFYLIEVNARQPASTTYESVLQTQAREKGARGLTTFEAHLRALRGLPIDQELIEISDGAQIVQRVTKNVQSIFEDACKNLPQSGYDVIVYQNSAPNSDLIRIQSPSGIIENHGMLNVRGREIAETIKLAHFNIQV